MSHDVHLVKSHRPAVDFNLSMLTGPVERLIATAQNGLEALRPRFCRLAAAAAAGPEQVRPGRCSELFVAVSLSVTRICVGGGL